MLQILIRPSNTPPKCSASERSARCKIWNIVGESKSLGISCCDNDDDDEEEEADDEGVERLSPALAKTGQPTMWNSSPSPFVVIPKLCSSRRPTARLRPRRRVTFSRRWTNTGVRDLSLFGLARVPRTHTKQHAGMPARSFPLSFFWENSTDGKVFEDTSDGVCQ